VANRNSDSTPHFYKGPDLFEETYPRRGWSVIPILAGIFFLAVGVLGSATMMFALGLLQLSQASELYWEKEAQEWSARRLLLVLAALVCGILLAYLFVVILEVSLIRDYFEVGMIALSAAILAWSLARHLLLPRLRQAA